MTKTDVHPFEHLTNDGLLKELDAFAAKASPCDDVEVSWYPMKDGTRHPQFEDARGGIAQEEGDYEFYAALRTAWPRLREALAASLITTNSRE